MKNNKYCPKTWDEVLEGSLDPLVTSTLNILAPEGTWLDPYTAGPISYKGKTCELAVATSVASRIPVLLVLEDMKPEETLNQSFKQGQEYFTNIREKKVIDCVPVLYCGYEDIAVRLRSLRAENALPIFEDLVFGVAPETMVSSPTSGFSPRF